MAVLAVAVAVQILALPASWVFTATGDGVGLLRYSLCSLAVKAVCILALARYGGLGVAWGFLIAVLIVGPAALSRSFSRAGVPIRGVVAITLGSVAFSVWIGGLARIGSLIGGPGYRGLAASVGLALCGVLLSLVLPRVRGVLSTIARISRAGL